MLTERESVCAPRDGWPIPGDASETPHGVEAGPGGSDQSLDESLTDPSSLGVDHWALVPSGGGGGATGQPSIDVRLKDLKLNFTLFDSRPPVSSPTQEDNLYPRIIKLPTSDDIPRSRPKMVTFDHDKVGHSPAVNQLPPETDSDGNLDMTDNRYAEMLCEAERVKAQMDQENECMKAELDDNLRRLALEDVVPNAHVTNPSRPTVVVTTEDLRGAKGPSVSATLQLNEPFSPC